MRRYQSQPNRLERELEWIISIVTAAAFVVSAIAALLLSRSLTRPIAALDSATRKISEGNLAYRLDYRGRDEFASLVTQIDNAASCLKAQRSALLNVQTGLEKKVTRRTREFEEANARLKKLDHMRMLFLADIGHDLRTPLTVLRGEAEIALADAGILGEANDIQIATCLPPGGCRAEGDAGRLAQTMRIVLDNAIKYADPGSVVRVGLSCGEGRAELAILNEGPEIPAADLPFVFSRFYRARQPANFRHSGTGLGLSIAKWIVEGHRGHIGISSADHRTAVRVSLPLLS
ncbi:sensor histidine kinase [Paracoccus siganidrum]|uniref:histidine kinase n=1 Tax=Paracoccus siganidrum TaxID=1276757 RepID=A0A419ABA5_9RHOB|nr:ATP-binding protein [Paracoccus siganidrum]RJL20745.1 HAMP domain-containing protein [Paracoccus siganidrum]RMC31947.1 hypothetical protein C9E82_15495 [Paracoccus siganidrum]